MTENTTIDRRTDDLLQYQPFKNVGRLLGMFTPMHRMMAHLIMEAESSPEVAAALDRAYEYANKEVKR